MELKLGVLVAAGLAIINTLVGVLVHQDFLWIFRERSTTRFSRRPSDAPMTLSPVTPIGSYVRLSRGGVLLGQQYRRGRMSQARSGASLSRTL